MADTKISALTLLTTPQPGDLLPLDDVTAGNISKRVTVADVNAGLLAPAGDRTLQAGYGDLVLRKYLIASGKKLTIRSAARFRIL